MLVGCLSHGDRGLTQVQERRIFYSMGVYYHIDKHLGLVTTVIEDVLTLQQCIDHHHKLGADPDFDAGFRELIDGASARKIEMGTASILEISRTCPYSSASRRAICSGDSLLFYGLARMFRAFAGGKHGEIMVFKKRHDALQWLGIKSS